MAPAAVAGPVVPRATPAPSTIGTPAAAKTSAASPPSRSMVSGETVNVRSLSSGRRRSSSALPAITVAISTARRACDSPWIIGCTCLTVLFQAASSSCICAASPQSPAPTIGHQ